MDNPKYIQVMRQVASDFDGISHELFQVASDLERICALRNLQAIERNRSHECYHRPRKQAGSSASPAGAEYHLLQ